MYRVKQRRSGVRRRKQGMTENRWQHQSIVLRARCMESLFQSCSKNKVRLLQQFGEYKENVLPSHIPNLVMDKIIDLSS